MKRIYLAAAIFGTAAVLMMGCGGSDFNVTEADKTVHSAKKTDETGEEAKGSFDDIDITKYVTLGNYKGLSVSVNETAVTDEEIKEAEENSLARLTTTKPVTGRAVREGDTVNIDYEGKKDGVAFQGGTAKGYDLKIGSGTVIDGFEDGLIGANTGDTKELHLTFPEDYHSADLAGQDVVFTVKINSISEDDIPVLNDETAKKLDPDVSTAKEYRDKLKEALQTTKTAAARTQAYNELFTQVQDSSDIAVGDAIPEWLVEQNKADEKENFEASLAAYGMDLNTYLTQQGMTEADFDKTLEAYAQSIARQQLLVQALAKAENISISDADVEAQYKEDAATYGYSDAEGFKAAVKAQGQEDSFKDAVLTRKVQEMLFKNAKVENPENVNW